MVCTSHAPNSRGYPYIRSNGASRKISRLVMFRRHGEKPSEIDSRHTCDNRMCINPDHIIPGTRLDNVHDMIERGRWVRPPRLSGSDHPRYKHGRYALGLRSTNAFTRRIGRIAQSEGKTDS